MHALRDLRELEGIAQQDHVAGGRAHRQCVRERDLAGLVDHQVVQLAVQILMREEPGGSGEELDVGPGIREGRILGVALDELAVVLGFQITGRRLLEPLEAHVGVPGDLLDLGEQIVDGLVAAGRDADAPAVREQVDDDARAGPRLARPGWALEEEVTGVQPERERLHLGEVRGLDPRVGGAAADSGPLAGEEPLQGGIAPVAAADRFSDAQDRRALSSIVDRPARDDLVRERRRSEARASHQLEGPADIVDGQDLARAPARRGIVDRGTRPKLVILDRESERMDQ